MTAGWSGSRNVERQISVEASHSPAGAVVVVDDLRVEAAEEMEGDRAGVLDRGDRLQLPYTVTLRSFSERRIQPTPEMRAIRTSSDYAVITLTPTGLCRALAPRPGSMTREDAELSRHVEKRLD